MRKKIFIIASFVLGFSMLIAQNDTDNKILLTAKNTGDKIILRWAPGDAGTWHISNYYGYMVERKVFKDSTDFFNTGFKLLTPDTLKPWPLDDWAKIANKASGDKYAALAAQAIWGERNKSAPESDASYWEKAAEFENLYAIALLSADFSANAAIASGLRYEDTNISPTLNYIYRVYSLASTDINPIDTAYILIKGNEIDIPVKVKIDEIFEKEKAVSIHWKRDLENNYTAWIVERSDDGKNYYRLTKNPYIDSPVEDSETDMEYINYTDSVEQNYVKHYYRIIGINTFAEYSSPSAPVSGMGRDRTPPPAPQNIKVKEIAPGKMEINWVMLDSCQDLKGFLVSRSNEINKEQTGLTNEILPKETRSYIDTTYDPLMNNWYYVYSVDTAGNAIVGIPQYGSIVDSIAPDPPTGLTGSIDSNGVVRIKWNLGKERDIYGYSIYSANQEDHIFIAVNNIPVRDTSFTDTITLKTLTENIYYKIATVDLVKNISGFSDVLVLKKPDIIPPVPPVFTYYKVTKDGIKLTWVQSSSSDVMTHYLYRKEKETEQWELIYRTNELKEYDTFIDNGTIPNKTYDYKIIAQDDDGLKSDISYILTLTAIDFTEVLPVENIQAFTNQDKNLITVKWEYPKEGKFTYHVFRAVNGGGFHFIKNTTQNQITDNISKGKTYEYTVNVSLNEKTKSGFSPIVKIDLTDKKEK